MLNVYLTFDVEIWLNRWEYESDPFSKAYSYYIKGKTRQGEYGLPFQLKLLNEYGCNAVFFIESLFSLVHDNSALPEIVSMITDAGQDCQLHTHTEWLKKKSSHELANIKNKSSAISDFSLDDQIKILSVAKQKLIAAGASDIDSYRAGNYFINKNTLSALASNDIKYDSSYNLYVNKKANSIIKEFDITQPECQAGVTIFPVSVYKDGLGKYRIPACVSTSSSEFQQVLLQAIDLELKHFVIVLHSFEFMNNKQRSPNYIAIKRYEKLLRFLNDNKTLIQTCTFNPTDKNNHFVNGNLHSSMFNTAVRMLEQSIMTF